MRLLAFVPILALLSAAPARAEGDGPCKSDLERFCKGVAPGEGRIIKCLKEHESELSEACRARELKVKGKAKERMREANEACKADKEKFCKDVEPGEGRIVACMKEHEKELSEACREQGMMMKEKREKMREHRAKMKGAKEACKADIEKLCAGVEPGEGRIMKCMKEHEAELSEGCKAHKMGKRRMKKEKKPEMPEESKD